MDSWDMSSTDTQKTLSQKTPIVAGLTLLALMVTNSAMPSQAQLPILPENQPVGTTISLTPPISDYTLGGGDRIYVEVFKLPDLSGDYQLPPDGALTLPLIGYVSLQGLTLTEANQLLSNRYAQVLKRPTVTVTLTAPRPLNVVIAGEVNRPGSYLLDLESGVGNQPGVQYPTLPQALEQAGGVTLAANIRRVQIRPSSNRQSAPVRTINLWELVQTGNERQNLTLRDGDTIFVPSLTTINLTEAYQIATSSFAIKPEEPRNVTIVGEVTRPGTYVVIGGNTTDSPFRTGGSPSLTQAIQLAGGIKPTADIRQIRLRRTTKAGAEYEIPVNLWQLLQQGDFTQDAILQDRDTIIVPTATDISPAEATELATATFSPEIIQVSVVGEVIEPGVVEVPPNTPLNQALLAAGGFDQKRAHKHSVELIRLNPDGTVSKRTIPIDFAQGINEQSNPRLQSNDIIVVNRSGTVRVTDTIGTILEPINPVVGILRIFELLGILQ
ncbi:Polysaccharide biosynthesis/export protein [Coleofasciculus chthonoplastes PCC 7420]|uniref:Polysaccharide biosynthesis/export protein n=2 Tax=Coleofasciculus chthonoplastes TaxID=64178 RepID=B4W5D5_9CYAN|nr:Polysaccharide biosynthesis/export protein [Coleofasciculus chthonoplastes PCC 7420]